MAAHANDAAPERTIGRITVAVDFEGGWKSDSMVERYAHLAPEHLARHAAVLDQVLPFRDGTHQVDKLAGKESS